MAIQMADSSRDIEVIEKTVAEDGVAVTVREVLSVGPTGRRYRAELRAGAARAVIDARSAEELAELIADGVPAFVATLGTRDRG